MGGDLGGVGARGRCHFEQESRAGILVWEGRGLGLLDATLVLMGVRSLLLGFVCSGEM